MAELTPLSLDDYEAIAAAVQETERGRWFLAEYARRNRAADTAQVLEALSGLERKIAAKDPEREKAVQLLEQAVRSVRRLRAAAEEERDRRLVELTRTLALALDALGARGQPRTRAEAPARAPLALAAPTPTPPAATQEVARIDMQQLEDQLRQDGEAREEEDAAGAPRVAAAASIAPAPRRDEAPPESPRVVATSPQPVASVPVARPRLPAAHAPLLLDGLSDAEKAILFA